MSEHIASSLLALALGYRYRTISMLKKLCMLHSNPRVFCTIFFKTSKLLPKLVDIAA